MRFAFVQAEKAVFPIRMRCRVLEVSPSGYDAWCQRFAAYIDEYYHPVRRHSTLNYQSPMAFEAMAVRR